MALVLDNIMSLKRFSCKHDHIRESLKLLQPKDVLAPTHVLSAHKQQVGLLHYVLPQEAVSRTESLRLIDR